MNRLRGLRYSIISSTGETRPLPTLSIPIARQSIRHRALTTAVSSLEAYSTPALPDAVAFPETTEDVSAIMKICTKFNVPVVPFQAMFSPTGPE